MKSRSKAIDGRFQLHFITAGLIVLLVSAPAVDLQADVDVDFNRDIRPLLSDRCFLCHGPDNDEGAGGFRLDAHASATAVADSGARPLVPHDAANSEILRRLQADDESQRMPPIDSGKPPLTAQQIDLIRKWIDKGGQYQKHWAFVTPERAPTPQVSQSDWVRDPIDQFLLSKSLLTCRQELPFQLRRMDPRVSPSHALPSAKLLRKPLGLSAFRRRRWNFKRP